MRKPLVMRVSSLWIALMVASALGLAGCSALGSAPSRATDASVAGVSSAPEVTVDEASFSRDEIAYAEENPGYEYYSDLDELGRCGEAMACLGPETLPARGEERESISDVRPTGWHAIRYDFVEGESLYNRSHLIGWALSAENDNERNLVTGTRWMNADAMRPFEEDVADYIYETDHHVLYRATPVFEGDELVCRGVRMEAYSLEDGGREINFSAWCPNVQPGVSIDYATGQAWADEDAAATVAEDAGTAPDEEGIAGRPHATGGVGAVSSVDPNAEGTYVLNTRSQKIHLPACEGAQEMSPRNREEFAGTIAEAEALGYTPCMSCLG